MKIALRILVVLSALYAWAACAAYTNKDFPDYLDPKPKKKSCNRIEYYTECKDLPHYRGKDYIPFRFHDEATDCSYDVKYDSCTYVSRMVRIKIRNGCLISWCARGKK